MRKLTMQTQELLDTIYTKFKLNPDDLAKKKYGKLPDITIKEIISRILDNNTLPISEIFPEMSRPVISRVLVKLFPNKVIKTQNWGSYILIEVGMKTCSKCTTIKSVEDFYSSKNKCNGIASHCSECDKKLSKAYRDNNPEAEKERNKQKYLRNKEYYIIKSKIRKGVITRHKPTWANANELSKIYSLCPDGYHVDHIVPLNGELVSGLHVECNLQYLTSTDNLSKGNNFNIDTYTHTCIYTAPYLNL